MNRSLLALAFLAVTQPTLADSYLCIAEANAGVRQNLGNNKNSMQGMVYTANAKWIIKNESDNWVVTEFGESSPSFVICETRAVIDIFCRDRVGQVFHFNSASSLYDSYLIRLSDTAIDHFAQKGRCSKI